ncbi:hypothetical protein [Candidatus Regiella insecticola]|nr:hypothetical protein [Candidatus Regiella insecticola]
MADNATARIHSGDLTVDKTTVIANNTDKATYTVRVTDASGNTLQH